MSTRSALARMALVTAVLAGVLAGMTGDQRPGQPAARQAVAGPGPAPLVRPAVARAPAAPACTDQNVRASLSPPAMMPAPGQMPAGSTMARIAKQGHLTVAVLEDTLPISFRDADSRLAGFDIDIARDIAEAIFGDREKVVFQPLREAARFGPLITGKLDLVIATVTINCKRREQMSFSAVYFEAAQRVLVNRSSHVTSLDDLRDKRVCAAPGSTSLGRLLSYPVKPVAIGAATHTDCLMLLQLGEVDAVSTDDTLLAGMAEQDPRTEIVGPRLAEEPYGVAINNNAPDLVRFVNGVLARRAQDGRWVDSYRRWLTPLGPPPPPPVPQYQD